MENETGITERDWDQERVRNNDEIKNSVRIGIKVNDKDRNKELKSRISISIED
jgi:hypothetical protein